VNLNQSKKLHKNELIAIASIALVILLSFIILEKQQDSTRRNQEAFDKEVAVLMEEQQKIISDGIENFIPTPGETEWPECATYAFDLTFYVMGYCDGSMLAQSQNEIANGQSDQKIILSYPELVTSADDSLEICNLATDIGQWEGTKFMREPFVEFGKLNINNEKDKSQYTAGCQMGIKKYFDFGQQLLTATLSAQQRRRDKQNQENSKPSPTNTSQNNSNGHWVRTCHWVQKANPNYNSLGTINDKIANPQWLNEQQCTDQFVN